MTLDVRPFKPTVDNVDIMNAVRKNATVDYQRRIPEATKANVQQTVQGLLSNRPSMNEFIDVLVNRIGMVIFKNIIWTNPLAKFKRGMLEYGDTIEEIMVGLLEAKTYDPDHEYLERDIFGTERPEVQASYHKVNRQNYYKVTVNESLLRRAFLSSNGLISFLNDILNAPVTSDNWDEFLLTTSLFNEYYRAGGFFKVNVPDVAAAGSTEAQAKTLLRSVRAYADTLPFISRHYNAAGMPVAASRDELELFLTPEASAALDVEALAAAFNIDRARIAERQTVIPKEQFNIPGAQAILTSRDFFVIADQKIETTSALNPVGLHTNYFLHHWQVVSASRFVPAILFTTEEGTTINVPATPVTSVQAITAIDGAGTTVTQFERGTLYEVDSKAITTPTGGANDAVRYELTGAKSQLSRVTQTGAIFLGLDEPANSVTVNAYAVDTPMPQLVATATFTVVGDQVILWPNPEVNEDADDDGLLEVTPKAPTFTTPDKVVVPNSDKVDYKDGATVVNGTTVTISGASGTTKTITATAKTGYEVKSGATASWTFTKA